MSVTIKLTFLVLSLLTPASAYCQRHEELKIERFPNGMPQAEYSFYRDKNGKEVWHGKRTEWTQNGKTFSEGTFLDGKAEGLRTYWHENGQKSAEGYYRNDEPVGVWLHWYADGQLQTKCSYSHGRKQGTCLYWNEKSREVDKVKYINGKPLAIVTWEKQNAGKRKNAVYLYPYIVVRPDNLIFTSNYADISKVFALDELERVFTSLPKSVWVNGKEIGVTSVGLASVEEHKRMERVLDEVTTFFHSKGYRVQRLPQ